MQINKRNKPGSKHQAHRIKDVKYYNSPYHRSLRKQAWERDLGKCRSCGVQTNLQSARDNTKRIAIADHIIPRRAGGEDVLDNIQILCKPCHDKKNVEDKKYYK